MKGFDDDPGNHRLEERRREAEMRMAALRRALKVELGAAPRRGGWWLLLAAGAVGLALGLGWRAAHRRRLEDGQEGSPELLD